MAQSPQPPQRTPAPQKAFPPRNRPNPSLLSARRCFKCQGLGHIVVNYPNREVITFAKWEVVKDKEKETEPEAKVEADDEESQDEYLAEPDDGEMLIFR